MFSDGAPPIVFEDRRYGGGTTRGFHVGPDDLKPIGSISAGPDGIDGTTAYALDGVDPSQVIVVHAPSAELGTDLILFREGAIADAAGYPLFPTIPGLCRYVTPTPSGCE